MLASEAGSSYHMSMYPEEGTVHAVMEQTYYALIDYNPPPTMQLMAERLVSGQLVVEPHSPHRVRFP